MQRPLFIQRLREVVVCFGARPAILDRGRAALTYDELWQQAQRVASCLVQNDIGRECIVGLTLPKSPEQIAAILGCWMARAAYVPLDPGLPSHRLRQIVENTQPVAALTNDDSPNAASQVVSSNGVRAVSWSESQGRPVTDHTFEPGEASDAAWVIPTSGTTGRPRGVLVEQRGYVNMLDAQREAFQISSSSRVLLLYSTAFDASLSDIGTALLSGAALHVEDADSVVQCGSILQLIRDRGITHADIPPALLAQHPHDDAPGSLETVVIGGEVCPRDVVRRWAGRVRLINVYGPTEATICTSLCECTPEWSQPLLGQPLPGVNYCVVDANNRLVANGESGELLIGGACLARGYVNSAEETKRKFVSRDGRRYYRTGDHVRVDDGEFVFLGRMDRQLKLRGHRIEAEEIEAAVGAVAGVRQCAVVHRPLHAGSGDRKVVAFLTTDRDTTPGELRACLRDVIPEPMIPARFEFLAAMPTSLSGKPDFSVLRALVLSEECSELDEPSELLSVFRSTLEIPTLGQDEDVFQAGADSLAVLALAAACQSRGIAIEPHMIVRERTVGRLLSVCADIPRTDGRTARSLRDDLRSLHQTGPAHHRPALTGEPRRTLLTGATGFLGSRLLPSWLERFDGLVVCLIRSTNDRLAAERLRRTLLDRGIELTPEQWRRVKAVAGDVTERHLGWGTDQWRDMAREVDTVVHSAANVHVFAPFEELRPANVVGTANVMRFVTEHRLKRVHYASTLSVFAGTDRNRGVVFEDDDLAKTREVFGGYAQSKWASEVLLRSAPMAVPLQIYRIGLLTGARVGGGFPKHDLFAMTVRGLADLGCVPQEGNDLEVDVTPVDFAAKAIVTIAGRQMLPDSGEAIPATWHIANAESLPAARLFRALRESCPAVEQVGHEEFLRRVRAQTGTDRAAACLSLCRWLSGPDATDHARPLDLFQATGMTFDMTRTLRVLQEAGVECPRPDARLIRRYIATILQENGPGKDPQP